MDLQAKIQEARQEGYSDQEIQTFLQQNGISQTPASVPPVPPTQPKSVLQGNLQGDNLVSGNDILSTIANAMARPFIKLTQAIPKINNDLSAYSKTLPNAKGNLGQSISNAAGETGKLIQDTLLNPDILKNSAAAASFGTPFGKGLGIVKQALLPGAIVGGAQALPEAQNVEDVVKGAAFGAGTAGVLGGASRLPAILQKIGTKTEEAGSEIRQGVRQIKQPASIYGAAKEADINNTLTRLGISGTPAQQYTQLEPAMNKLKDNIQKVIKDNPDITVTKAEIKDSFMDNLKSSLRSKDLTNSQANTEIDGYLNDLIKASGGKGKFTEINLERLRNLKKLVNEDYGPVYKINQAGGALTPRQKVISAAWDSLDEAVKGASPEMKQLLSDESNLYKAAPSLSGARFTPPTFRAFGTSIPSGAIQTAQDATGRVINKTGEIVKNSSRLSPNFNPSIVGQIGSRLSSITKQTQDENNQTQNNSGQNNTDSNFNKGQLPPITSISQPAEINQAPKNPLAGYTVDGQPISRGDAALIYDIANYKIDPTKSTSLRTNERKKLMELVAQYDPSYDQTQYNARAKLRQDFTSGKGANNIRSLNTAVGHLQSLADASQGLGNTSLPAINTIKNIGASAIGQPQVVKFNNAVNAVAGEMATVFKGTSGTDQEIKSWKDQMNASQSPEQVKQGINQMIELMASRLAAFNSQWELGMGKPKDFRILSNRSRQILQNLGQDVGAIDPVNQ